MYKKLLIFGLIGSLCLYMSCAEVDSLPNIHTIDYSRWVYFNKSSHTITIENWLHDFNDVYEIKSGDSLVTELDSDIGLSGCSINDEAAEDVRNCFINSSDSARVIFDGERQYMLYDRDSTAFNFLFNDNYLTVKRKSSDIVWRRYVFTFTNEDYDRASTIN